jgi:hypothetical protein
MFWLVPVLAVVVVCQSESPSSAVDQEKPEQTSSLAHENSTSGVENQSPKHQPEETEMTQITTFERVPEDYDPRLTAILSDPIPNDVIVSFYYMAASKNPSANYRWELHRDGRLFVVHHSGQNPSYEITFDQPLPTQPTKTLTNGEIRELYAQLDRSDFFSQPGLQREPRARGGNHIVLRVRRGDTIHEVVYQNVEGPLVEYLYSIAY